ncbi:putative glyoxalase superfamily protein PhnB [Kribbella amoyensis]|uniref:Putative glyoxalase superfamily protein PhnB n=1 Tax=Kribbella amoyensis TaxID=996641 RepID=A0A561C1A8_9ACTN|nr:VOC family protein [Kribbella amoyensis]TWD84878.1 putative glyoxalase superfamily protein PhnB [Kribbella amoyensis]
MTKQSASATVEVAAEPGTAFHVFTAEIDLWWVRGPINFFDAGRAIGMQIEPGVGGRILEVYRRAAGDTGEDVLELGRITVWEPGARFAYRSSVDDTETDIRFEPCEAGTRVSVEQTLLPGGDKAFYFWPNVIPWLVTWTARRGSGMSKPGELGRLSIALYYANPVAAAEWLQKVYGLEPSLEVPDEDGHPSWIEFRIGSSAILLFPQTDSTDAPRNDHEVWVYVDDLDAHFAHSTDQGATITTPIQQHGYRAYQTTDLEGHHWTFAQATPTTE